MGKSIFKYFFYLLLFIIAHFYIDKEFLDGLLTLSIQESSSFAQDEGLKSIIGISFFALLVGPLVEEFSFRNLGRFDATYKKQSAALLVSSILCVIIKNTSFYNSYGFSNLEGIMWFYLMLAICTLFLIIFFHVVLKEYHLDEQTTEFMKKNVVKIRIVLTLFFFLAHTTTRDFLSFSNLLTAAWIGLPLLTFSFFSFRLYDRYQLKASIIFHSLYNSVFTIKLIVAWYFFMK